MRPDKRKNGSSVSGSSIVKCLADALVPLRQTVHFDCESRSQDIDPPVLHKILRLAIKMLCECAGPRGLAGSTRNTKLYYRKQNQFLGS